MREPKRADRQIGRMIDRVAWWHVLSLGQLKHRFESVLCGAGGGGAGLKAVCVWQSQLAAHRSHEPSAFRTRCLLANTKKEDYADHEMAFASQAKKHRQSFPSQPF